MSLPFGTESVQQIIKMPCIKSSISNVISMRMMSHFVQNTRLGFERFYLLFPFGQSESALRSMPESFLPTFDIATVCVRVLGGGGLRTRVTHRIAGSTGNSSFFLTFYFFNFVGGNIVKFLLLTYSLNGGFFQYPIAALLSVEHILTQMTALPAISFLVSI